MRRHEISDAHWTRVLPLLPPQRPKTGRPSADHRQVVNGVLWVLATGAPWRDLLERYGSWRTVYSRFRRWLDAGVWQSVLSELQRQADARGELDGGLHFVDGSVVRAQRSAADAKRGGDQALGLSRGGWGTKVHVRCEGGGRPVCFVLSGGERHESRFLPALMEGGSVRRPTVGRPRLRPERVAADKGYSHPTVRAYLRARGIGAAIPTRKDQRRSPRFDAEAYRRRNAVERAIGRLKQFRRIATRYEKLASSYLAMLTLAAIRVWL